MSAPSRGALACKRAIDVVVAATGLLVASPLLLVVTGLEIAFHGWPPLFVQIRPGRDERLFPMLKFRSMTNERGPDGELLPDAERLTRFGRALRASSLDELPELVNVLLGHMSLVGPRPLLPRYLDRYNARQRRRHAMRPGLTGLAAVSGRNRLSWEERLELDVRYIETWSLKLDLIILWRTVLVVLRREGIQGEGSETMDEFRGTAAPTAALRDANPTPGEGHDEPTARD